MIVKELRRIIDKFHSFTACAHKDLLNKQKLGFTFKETYKNPGFVIDGVVAAKIMKANTPLLESDKVRIPKWLDKQTFLSFIAKLNKTCQ